MFKKLSQQIIKMKVLLLFPPITVNTKSVKKCTLPTGLAYIASTLEKNNHEVYAIDMALEGYETERKYNNQITFGLSDEEIKDKIKKINPEMVGISSIFSSQFHNTVHVSRLVKEVLDVPVVIGGVHPTFESENILRDNYSIDAVVSGEGEFTMLDLANKGSFEDINGLIYKKESNIIRNNDRGLVKNLDEIPSPAFHLFDMEKYIQINKPFNHFPKKDRVLSITTSRGCYGRCTFCSSAKFWGNRLRYRTADSVIKEMEELKEKYNVQELQIYDDNLTGWPIRAKDLFRRMKKLDLVWCAPNGVRIDTIDDEMLGLMKESGCYRLTYAVESGDEHILHDIIKKPYDLNKVKPIIEKTKKAGIGVHTYWIIGFPEETKEQMFKTYNFAKSLKTESASFCLATPMVGTELFKLCKEKNVLEEGFDVQNTNYRHTSIKNPNISKKELESLCDHFNESINKSLLWNNPVAFFKKYYRVFRHPKELLNMFKKFS
jgi:radical SAM superfamily enzyme YgiQ (UPF0313 family)